MPLSVSSRASKFAAEAAVAKEQAGSSARDAVGQLIQCIKARDLSALQAALDAGADEVLDMAGATGLTPLLYAARVCWAAGVDVLLVHGASALVRTPAQDTALHFAALKGANDILQMLIAAGADVNAVGDVHNRPLHLAAAAEQLEAVHLLLVAGADVRVINCYGHTPLALACKGSRVRQCLLQAEEGGPAEAQRLKQTLQLQHLQSRAARDATQRAAQEERQRAEQRAAAAAQRRAEEDEAEDRAEEAARAAAAAAEAARLVEIERLQQAEAAARAAEAAAAKAAALAAKPAAKKGGARR